MKKYRFDKPLLCRIWFKRYGKITVNNCAGVYLGNICTVVYIARDEKEHRHKYREKEIIRIECGGELIYSRKN